MSNADVFISYKSDDYSLANQFRIKLLENGVSCWMAPESIKSGDSYGVAIPEAIENCKVFLLIMTKNIFSSKWVPKELDGAINAGVRIFPIMIENLKLKAPYSFFLSDIQCYYPQRTFELTVDKTVSEIKTILESKKQTNDDADDTADIHDDNDANVETAEERFERLKREREELEEKRKSEEMRRYNEELRKKRAEEQAKRKQEKEQKHNTTPETETKTESNQRGRFISGYESNGKENKSSMHAAVGFLIVSIIVAIISRASNNTVLFVLSLVIGTFSLICVFTFSNMNKTKVTNYSLYENRFTGKASVENESFDTVDFDVSFKEINSIKIIDEKIHFIYNNMKCTVFAKNSDEAYEVVTYILMHKN